ncbi:MAG: hypothetical protein KDB79_12050 [Acidobacteria bacterium]|nr:hypothetical protein [Acidobacteriota bacterium]
MSSNIGNIFAFASNKKATILFLSVVFFFAAAPDHAFGQRKFSKSYPASKNIRLELTNRTGTIIVRGWEKDEVNISAYLEKPIASIEPQNLSGTILINVIKDNQGKGEVGSVNFTIYVPYTSTVDIETRVGNIEVSNVQGGLVRAHISSEGDITLTNIGAAMVSAKNVIGDIFYDGLIRDEGIYRFVSTNGNINLRIPFRASFRLVATAPSSRYISLGEFRNSSMSYVGNGRRVVGKVGSGSASLTVTNQRGTISLIRR